MATYWENSCSFGLRYVSWYKYLIVSLVFSHLGFWSGDLFLIAPFPDLCLLVPFSEGVLPYMSVAATLCGQNIANKISMPLTKEAPQKISTQSAKRLQRRNYLKF